VRRSKSGQLCVGGWRGGHALAAVAAMKEGPLLKLTVVSVMAASFSLTWLFCHIQFSQIRGR
jgi:hypothetical protein